MCRPGPPSQARRMTTDTGDPDARTGESQHRTEPPFAPFQPADQGPGRIVLRRSFEDRMVTGVAGGLSRYLGVDVSLVRIAFVILTLVGGAGIPLYLAGLLLIPEEGSDQSIAGSLSESLRSRPRDSVGPASMTAPSSPPRAHGVSPRSRGSYSDPHMRVSDAERRTVADRLAEHFADGRLDQAEFDERAGRAMSAKTRADLSGLFDDLPETAASALPVRAQRGHAHPALLLALVVVAVAAAHLVLPGVPWLFLGTLGFLGGLIGAVLVFVTWGTRHSRRDQRRKQP
jgi:phage shock protein C